MNPSHKQPSDPVYFIGPVTWDSVVGLIDQIRKRVPTEGLLEVVFSTTGGSQSAALGFCGWMKRFSRQQNVRAVASGQIASAGITMFLAFDRRAADATSQFRFHLLSPDVESDDAALKLLIKESEEQLVGLIKERTRLTEKIIRELMEERIPLSGDPLIRAGICNEQP